MYPWEHFAVGYIVYSLTARLLGSRTPRRSVFLAILLGSQFPDLVDKPASWFFNVFPTGVSVAHSVFVAVPVSVTVVIATYRVGRSDIGLGFGTAYLLHLPGDALYRTLTRGLSPEYDVFLWPVAAAPTNPPGGLLVNAGYYLGKYPELLASVDARFFLFEGILLWVTFLLWMLDGVPGLPIDELRQLLAARQQEGEPRYNE